MQSWDELGGTRGSGAVAALAGAQIGTVKPPGGVGSGQVAGRRPGRGASLREAVGLSVDQHGDVIAVPARQGVARREVPER